MKLEATKILKLLKKQHVNGIKGIFTAHSISLDDLMHNNNLNKMIKNKFIEKVILIDKKHQPVQIY